MDARTRAYVVRTIDRAVGDWSGMSRDTPGALTAADLRTVASPTLLLCGERTRFSMHRIIEKLRTELPTVEYEQVPGAGHMSPLTHHARVNEFIVEFLARQTVDC
jgi:pimeloyl-ACP methyl ester carboxylesterase